MTRTTGKAKYLKGPKKSATQFVQDTVKQQPRGWREQVFGASSSGTHGDIQPSASYSATNDKQHQVQENRKQRRQSFRRSSRRTSALDVQSGDVVLAILSPTPTQQPHYFSRQLAQDSQSPSAGSSQGQALSYGVLGAIIAAIFAFGCLALCWCSTVQRVSVLEQAQQALDSAYLRQVEQHEEQRARQEQRAADLLQRQQQQKKRVERLMDRLPVVTLRSRPGRSPMGSRKLRTWSPTSLMAMHMEQVRGTAPAAPVTPGGWASPLGAKASSLPDTQSYHQGVEDGQPLAQRLLQLSNMANSRRESSPGTLSVSFSDGLHAGPGKESLVESPAAWMGEECCVCLDALANKDGAQVVILPCAHKLHRHCAIGWAATQAEPRCPTCLAPMFTDQE